MPTSCLEQEAEAKKEVLESQKAHLGTSPEAASELSLHVIASGERECQVKQPGIFTRTLFSRVSCRFIKKFVFGASRLDPGSGPFSLKQQHLLAWTQRSSIRVKS